MEDTAYILNESDWKKVEDVFESIFQKRANDLNAFLFLIGIQELGKGVGVYSKEEKQDLMHIGNCALLSLDGFYKKEFVDEQGWPHYSLIKTIPHLKLKDQELMLKCMIVKYFEINELL